jgi:hypothetical protein
MNLCWVSSMFVTMEGYSIPVYEFKNEELISYKVNILQLQAYLSSRLQDEVYE